MAFYYLLLGHLVGDFVLQTDKIAQNKGRYWKWNLLHVLVVTTFTLILGYPFGVFMLLLVGLNGIIHFFLDYYKAKIVTKLGLSDLSGFLLDQSLHILLLFLVSQFAVYREPHLIDIVTVNYLLALTFITSFSAVFTQFVLSAIFYRDGCRFFEKGEKNTGILSRLYMSIVFYISFVLSPWYLLLLPAAAAAFLIQYSRGWEKWMSRPHLAVKLILDIVISVICVSLLIML